MNTRQVLRNTSALMHSAPAAATSRSRLLDARFLALLATILVTTITGCGSPGSPQPPSLKIPTPVIDLSAGRTGNDVMLHWTMPRRATDRVLLAGDQRVVICRGVAARPCTSVGEQLLQPGKPGEYTDTLPAGLNSGPPQLLTYTVLLQNHSRHDAGPSNSVYVAGGAAPPKIAGVAAKAEAEGIVLRWAAPQAAGAAPGTGAAADAMVAQRLVRLQRTRVLAPGEAAKPTTEENQTGVPQPVDQTLEVGEPAAGVPSATLLGGWGLDHAIDKDATLNRTYRYSIQQVARLTLGGHTVEVSSVPSAAVSIEARDVFPPAVPAGLQAVADAEGDAIDLSWTPDSDPDTAGYFVYRRPAGSGTASVRVSGKAAVVDSAWRDTGAAAGVRYAYSVSAVDTSGNESARSPEVTELVSPVPADRKPVPEPGTAGQLGRK